MLTQKKIKVLIVDDSLVFDRFLSEALPKVQSRIEVVGYALNAFDAMRKIPKLKPDVITLDVEMPQLSGIDFLKKLLPENPLPVILVSSLNVSVFNALAYGAVDFVRKPDMQADNTTSIFVQNLASKILIASYAKVHVQAKAENTTAKPVSTPAVSKKSVAEIKSQNQTATSRPSVGGSGNNTSSLKLSTSASLRLNRTVIAIGASTGGTEATLQVLQQLPADIPGIVVTQHMPKGFTKMYAERLNRLCRMEVKEAEDGDIIRRGHAFIAPGGDLQMKVERKDGNYAIRCYPGEKVSGHRPSVDVLFESVANTAKRDAVGIILTGMGHDGAEGLLKMRKAGAYTIGQDKVSCVVYGMPMVAYDIGGVCVQASCSSIASVLVQYLNGF